jgi:hypothetical protein
MGGGPVTDQEPTARDAIIALLRSTGDKAGPGAWADHLCHVLGLDHEDVRAEAFAEQRLRDAERQHENAKAALRVATDHLAVAEANLQAARARMGYP